jgi:hypothetical protein
MHSRRRILHEESSGARLPVSLECSPGRVGEAGNRRFSLLNGEKDLMKRARHLRANVFCPALLFTPVSNGDTFLYYVCALFSAKRNPTVYASGYGKLALPAPVIASLPAGRQAFSAKQSLNANERLLRRPAEQQRVTSQ